MERITKIEHNSIELLFCVPFNNLKRHPLDDEASVFLMQLLMADNSINVPYDELPFIMKVIKKRIEVCMNYTIDTKLLIFLGFLSVSPGNAVMYVTYLQWWCKQHDVKELTLDVFCERIFPIGFPSQEDMTDLWDKCKVSIPGSDNLLDHPEAFVSIKF